jgi:hypothetical protein
MAYSGAMEWIIGKIVTEDATNSKCRATSKVAQPIAA